MPIIIPLATPKYRPAGRLLLIFKRKKFLLSYSWCNLCNRPHTHTPLQGLSAKKMLLHFASGYAVASRPPLVPATFFYLPLPQHWRGRLLLYSARIIALKKGNRLARPPLLPYPSRCEKHHLGRVALG